jgi:hypothetical protein
VTSHDADPDSPDDHDVVVVPAADAPDEAGIAAAARAMRLVELCREIEKHVATEGWDQPARLFALARTAELVALEPALAEALGAEGHDPESLTPIEQDPVDADRPLDDLLATTMWPDEVVGAALVLERIVLPPSAEDALPDDTDDLDAVVAAHPDREDVRMAVVVLRDGGRMCAVRLRAHDVDSEVLVGPDVVPRLADALAATLS